ncbi:hypothetical protein D1AOALGA4SA_8755 [Olavius algarvensis Delta 1 endosymbiont]|nr:hypothetical protein D1AOALGA4SA_8755 [Olavius algarvensis Delta 1 endosymbiont]
MEYWKYKADDGLILQTDPCHFYTNRSHSTKPSIPAFQYSIIPLSLAADSRHSRGALTWPRGPGFLRRKKYSVRKTTKRSHQVQSAHNNNDRPVFAIIGAE